MDDEAEPVARAAENAPLPVSVLADLQAGILDDDTAARVRRRIRTDPAAAHTAAALDRVRRDLAELGSTDSVRDLPDIPADVAARLSASHAARGSAVRARSVALLIGGAAAIAAVGIGVAALVDTGTRAPSVVVTADRITASRAPTVFPVPRDELLALLDRPADLGALSDAVGRAACLSALGFPGSAAVLGAEPLDIGGRPAVVLLLAGDTDGTLTALAVAPTCGAADPGLVAETVVARTADTP